MKKIIHLLLVSLFAIQSAWADDISKEKAQSIAKRFMQQNALNLAKSRKAPVKSVMTEPSLAYTLTSKGRNNVYVYNLGGDGGFVIVSGETGTDDEVLGWCDHGSFDYDQAPDQLKFLLGTYSDGIDSLRAKSAMRMPAPRKASVSYVPIVGPLLTTTWDQRYPYNKYCPDGCPAGCVPVAYAQILNYWKWPLHPKGTVRGEDYSTHTFDWENMLDDYSDTRNATTEQIDAVAHLLRDIGALCHTAYAPDGSPTYSYLNVFTNAFRFQPDAGEEEMDIADLSFEEKIKAELKASRPVLYTASPAVGASHALVCDGYAQDDYYHFNFGWGGYSDGYYKLHSVKYFLSCHIFTNLRPFDGTVITHQGIVYDLMPNGTAEAISVEYDATENSEIIIPDEVSDGNGKKYPVVRIRENFARGSGEYQKRQEYSLLQMGNNVKTVDKGAFVQTEIEKIIFSDAMEEIPDEMFLARYVGEIVLGKNIKRIGKKAFYYSKVSRISSKSPSFDIDEYAFVNSYPIPGEWCDCVHSIGKCAFQMATFKEMPYFSNLVEIGPQAFIAMQIRNQSSTSKVFKLSPKVRRISPDAFDNTLNLKIEADENNPYLANEGPSKYLLLTKDKKDLIMTSTYRKGTITYGMNAHFPPEMLRLGPGSVRKDYVFDIPSSVVEMEGAFSNCKDIKDLACYALNPPHIGDASMRAALAEGETKLYVPKGKVDAYRKAPGWRLFTDIQEISNYDYWCNEPDHVELMTREPMDDREEYMVLHRSANGSQDTKLPTSQVTGMHVEETDGIHRLVVTRAAENDYVCQVAHVDSITWEKGFLFGSEEVYNVNEDNRYVESRECNITLSKAVVDEDTQLRVSNFVAGPLLIDQGIQGKAVDISLANGETKLSGIVTIAFPMEHAEDEFVVGAYYNEETGQWEVTEHYYDEDTKQLILKTNHLSTYGAFTIKNAKTRAATLCESAFYELLGQLPFEKVVENLKKITDSENPMEVAISSFKEDHNFISQVGFDMGYSAFQAIGCSNPLLDEIGSKLGDLGTCINIYDLIRAELKGDKASIAQTALSMAVSQIKSTLVDVFSTNLLTASMVVVAFVEYAINKFGTEAWKGRLDIYRAAYRTYYGKETGPIVAPNSTEAKHPGGGYRSVKDWVDILYPIVTHRGYTREMLAQRIDAIVSQYCNWYWEEYEAVRTWSTQYANEKLGFSYLGGLLSGTQEKLSEEFRSELYHGVLTEAFAEIKNMVQYETYLGFRQSVDNYRKMMNTKVYLRFKDSKWKEGRDSDFKGLKMKFNKLPGDIQDPEKWECTLDEKGYGWIGMTFYAMVEAGIGNKVCLYGRDDIEKQVYEFSIPAFENRKEVFIDIDLATAGVEVEYPILKDLQLTYDPLGHTFYTTTIGWLSESYPYESEEEPMAIFFEPIMSEKYHFRWQAGIEKFFAKCDNLVIMPDGTLKIGKDIVGVYDKDTQTGTGSFVLDTSYDFVEQTVEQFESNYNTSTLNDWTLANGLLTGNIKHKINCNFSLTYDSEQNIYYVDYQGTGTYAVQANVVGEIEGVNWERWPYYINGAKVTGTKVVTCDGNVTLKFVRKIVPIQ
ncbi:MAG: C10 family peptidase [Bacteroidaceae bacterium]|nr:C10 family peptidase [Bacteroidaceae bacterium]